MKTIIRHGGNWVERSCSICYHNPCLDHIERECLGYESQHCHFTPAAPIEEKEKVMEKNCGTCGHSSKNNSLGKLCSPEIVGFCSRDYSKWEPVVEICCENCKFGPYQTCDISNNCLRQTGKHNRPRGKYDKYYNHFVPKKAKAAPVKPDKFIATPNAELSIRTIVADTSITREEVEKLFEWADTAGGFHTLLGHNLFNISGFVRYATQDLRPFKCFREYLLEKKLISERPMQVGEVFSIGEEKYEVCEVFGNGTYMSKIVEV